MFVIDKRSTLIVSNLSTVKFLNGDVMLKVLEKMPASVIGKGNPTMIQLSR